MTAGSPSGGLAGLRPVWEREGRDWPNRSHSRFIDAAGTRWHVQMWGKGPALLLHGTGASTHSWRGLAPLLARRFSLVAPDLPGHGFTGSPPPTRLSLPGMAWSVRTLLARLGVTPAIAVGHSAGAAILARLCLDGAIAPAALVALNGALLPLAGMPAHLFSPLARLLYAFPVVPLLFSWRAHDRATVERLLRGTGSTLDAAGVDYYARLMRSSAHVRGALGMMARWDLGPLARDLPRLATPLILVVGENDRAIPPSEVERVRALAPGTRVVRLPGLGHLAHEERPDLCADAIEATARAASLIGDR